MNKEISRRYIAHTVHYRPDISHATLKDPNICGAIRALSKDEYAHE